jgi:hypothetical protein
MIALALVDGPLRLRALVREFNSAAANCADFFARTKAQRHEDCFGYQRHFVCNGALLNPQKPAQVHSQISVWL